MRSKKYLMYLSSTSTIFAALILFTDVKPDFYTIPFSVVIILTSCMIIFLLGLFSMMAQLEYPPISIRAAAFIGIMSLVSLIVAFASIFRHFGIVDSLNATLDRDPIDCLYFSVVTWTTLGYGDFRPSAAIRMTAAAEALIGYVGMVGLISISAQYIVATVGLSEQEIDKFNKGLERYESKRSDNPRTRKKRG